MNEQIVYLNNEYISESKATVSIFDRGFLFADGIYEVIPVYSGKVMFLEDHLNRLRQNLAKIKINYEVNDESWQNICTKLIETNGPDKPIYLQITRGADKTRLHAYPETLTPTVLALSLPAIKLGSCLDTQEVKVVTLDDIRWQLCNIKSISLLGNILLNQEAYKQEANEALLVNHQGHVVEGASCNYFIVKDNTVFTPKLNHEILPGITRKIVMELLAKHNVEVVEKTIDKQEIYHSDELWLTSSTREIRNVTSIDGHKINNGQPGQLWRQAAAWYVDFIEHTLS